MRYILVSIIQLAIYIYCCSCSGNSHDSDGNGHDCNCDCMVQWAVVAGGVGDDYPSDIHVSPEGSILITGAISGEATFGENDPNETVLSTQGEYGVFVAKYGLDGKLTWARSDGGDIGSQGNSISSSADGHSVVSGMFYGEAVFGSGEMNETILNSEGSADIFIASYDGDRSLRWAKQAGASDIFPQNMNDIGYAVFTALDGSSYITGCFRGTAVFGKGETNERILVATPMEVGPPFEEVFLAKYNPDGSLAWARSDGGSRYDCGYGVTAMENGSSLVTGTFVYQATFGSGEPNEALIESEWYEDVFIARYSPDGILEWVSNAGGPGSEIGLEISVLSDGSFIVAGTYDGEITFARGESNEITFSPHSNYEMFIARYYPDGNLNWVKTTIGSGSAGAGSLFVGADGSFVVAGGLKGEETFGLGEQNETTLLSSGEGDVFVASYDEEGSLKSACRIGGVLHENHPSISRVSDSVYLAGSFPSIMDIKYGEGDFGQIVSHGMLDIFLLKIRI